MGGARSVRIVAHHRIHVGLADMGFASQRAYGGVGITIGRPCTIVELTPAEEMAFEGFESIEPRVRTRITEICASMLNKANVGGFRVVLRTVAAEHVGFGTTTTLVLAVISGINFLFNMGLSESEMQRLSGRGGASGIGIHSFFGGGVIWDGGHALPLGTDLTPSGAGARKELPPLLARLDFPSLWRIALFLPNDKPTSGESEIDFFRKNTPVALEEALRTMAVLYHGVLPAIKLCDIAALTVALRALHRTGFKKRELDARSQGTRATFAEMERLKSVAVGMSSVGPLLYAIYEASNATLAEEISALLRDREGQFLGVVLGHNQGFKLERDDA